MLLQKFHLNQCPGLDKHMVKFYQNLKKKIPIFQGRVKESKLPENYPIFRNIG